MKKILFFQLESFHEELLPGFAEPLIKCGVPYKIYTNRKAFNSKGNILNESAHAKDLIENTIFHEGYEGSKACRQYIQTIKEEEADIVILMTFYSDCTVEIAKELIKRKIQVYSVIHNVKKTINLPKVKSLLTTGQVKPIFLSDHVSETFKSHFEDSKEKQLCVIYNIFTPSSLIAESSEPESRQSAVNFSILGGINLKNFDYYDVINFINHQIELNQECIFKFHFAGGGQSRSELINHIEELGLSKYFSFSKLNASNRCDYNDYYSIVKNTDLVLCIKRGGIGRSLERSRITSTIPTGLSFHKPFVCSNPIVKDYGTKSCSIIGGNLSQQLEKISVAYSNNNFKSKMTELAANSKRVALEMKKKNIKAYKKLTGESIN